MICKRCGKYVTWLNWLAPSWGVCNPCQTAYIRTTIRAVGHRPTRTEVHKHLETALMTLRDSIREKFESQQHYIEGLEERIAIQERRSCFLEERIACSKESWPVKPVSKSETIRQLLRTEPTLTAIEIQRRTGIKPATIWAVMSHMRTKMKAKAA
jgi:hypothetical protein